MGADLFPDLQPKLCWTDMPLDDELIVLSGTLERGNQVQLVLSETKQHQLFKSWLNVRHPQCLQVIQSQKKLNSLGYALGVVLSGRGLLANITIQENIMLPFLYHDQLQYTKQAYRQLEKVAQTLGLENILDEQTGLRSPLIHGLVSLCRCVLQQASFIVMQQPCTKMSNQEQQQFRDIAKRVVTSLGAGLLYVTDTIHDDGGFKFDEQLDVQNGELGQRVGTKVGSD